MSKRVWFFIFFFYVVSPFWVCLNAVEFKLLNVGKRELGAGEIFNLVLNCNNSSDSIKEFRVNFISKDSIFKPLMSYSSLKIDKFSNFNKIIGVQVPSTCRSGDYTLQLNIFEKPLNQVVGSMDVIVTVKPRFDFEIINGSTPQFALSGDTLTLSSIVQNLSNQDISVKASAIDDGAVKSEILKIPQGGHATFNYSTTISKDISTYMRKLIIVNASIQEKEDVGRSTSYSFEVFPGKDLKFDKFNRVPIRIGGLMVATNRWGGLRYSAMYDVSGAGFFGINKDRMLVFNLRGPDRAGDPLLGQEESFNFRYSTKRMAFSLGDDVFGLSELSESSRGGRGIKAMIKPGKWTIGGFFNRPMYYPLIKEIVSVYGSYDMNERNSVNAGVLSKIDTLNQLVSTYTASARITPFSWLNTNIEYALGQMAGNYSNAYKGSVSIQSKLISTYFNFLYADPNFIGYMSNSTRLNGGLSYSMNKFNFSTNISLNRTNIALDTIYSNMPYSENYNVSLSYRLSRQSLLSLGGFISGAEDLSPEPLFNYLRYSGRLSFQTGVGSLRLGLQGDYGKMINKLNANQGSYNYTASFNTSYELSAKMSLNAYSNLLGGQQGITGYDQFYYGGSFVFRKGDRFLITLNYNSNFEWQFYTSDRSLINLNLTTKPFKNHEISFSINQNLKRNTLNNKELNMQLRYVYILDLPVSIRKDVGSVSGKLINHGVKSVSGIRLNLNGIVVLTDKDGFFRFPAVPVGSAILGVDVSTLGLNTIIEKSGPYKLTIQSGKTTIFDLAVTKSSHIGGRFVVKEDQRSNQRGFIAVKEPMGRLIVEVSDSSEVFRVFSDDDGSFSFNDLRPGIWKVKIYTNNLAQGYQIDNTQYELELASGESKNIDVAVSKKVRQIQFQRSTKNN